LEGTKGLAERRRGRRALEAWREVCYKEAIMLDTGLCVRFVVES
jgi:hypothetical protein